MTIPKWSRPLFTGAWTGRLWDRKVPTMFRGITMKRLLSSEWIKIFPTDAAIRKDSDGDGLTDVVEARLGTDPRRADTDGDGIPDNIDPCPNAAPRPQGDTEKIVAATIQARFFQEDYNVPAVLSVQGVKPFEFNGYGSTVMWAPEGRKSSSLGSMYGGGVNLIGFHSAYENERSREGFFIRYSDDHHTAHTLISRYSGGLNGDGTEVVLHKIGNSWFVIDLVGRYVS